MDRDVSGSQGAASDAARHGADADDGGRNRADSAAGALSGEAGRRAMSDPTAGDASVGDPLVGDPRVQDFLGPAYPTVAAFHSMLTEDGVLRGLIGPREVRRLWERHLLNSASVAAYLPTTGRLVDIGSGAGLPGIVLAAMLPEVEVVLLEPMERRVDWLAEVAERLRLANVVVRRGRAEEAHGELVADAVTARAVAPMDRLARWSLPLLRAGGMLVALKGRQAADEVASARHVLRKLGAGSTDVLEAATIDGVEPTTVVRVVRTSVKGGRA